MATTKEKGRVNLWGEYGKRFTNGHKTLTSAETNALTEFLAHEQHKRENFELLKRVMTKPRNPLAGDKTPRTENGNVVLNPNAHGQVANAPPLFDVDRTPRILPPEKWAQGQIGVPDGKYNILGNSGVNMMAHSAQPKNLYTHVQEEALRKSTLAAEERELSEAKRKAAAIRQQRILAQQVATLKLISEAKQKEMNELRNKFN
jgi:hypothetical protein